MTQADDDMVELRELDRLFEEMLAGEAPAADAPAWCGDLARLVTGARAEATPGELAAHDDIVARMVEVRLATPAEDPVEVVAPPFPAPAPVATADVSDPAQAPVARLDVARSPRHAADRSYQAKHAATRRQAASSPAAAARNVGRLLAVKAAAVTTAVVVGTVAAAAATTGIVANVVVPALTDEAPDAPPATKTTIGLDPDRGGGTGGEDDDLGATVGVPACQLTPVCSPLTPAAPSAESDPGLDGPTGPTVPTTERPTTTTEPPATTTTTAPTTTQPEPTTTTSEPPPTTEPTVGTMSSPVPAAPASP